MAAGSRTWSISLPTSTSWNIWRLLTSWHKTSKLKPKITWSQVSNKKILNDSQACIISYEFGTEQAPANVSSRAAAANIFVFTNNFSVSLHDCLTSYQTDDIRAILWGWERTSGETLSSKVVLLCFLKGYPNFFAGYQREQTYRHKDGSYSAFGEHDSSGSTW